ncbi:hypothetical protein ACEWY4_022421 [Coilia grayii]|uniref:VWFA domain-containing protein n=1 Tax=Coilia grayii TaxID=363190 RepID=A0ABD1J5Z6_9TELE
MEWLSIVFVILIWQNESVAVSSVIDDCTNRHTPVDIVLMLDGTWDFEPTEYALFRTVLEDQVTKMNINFTQSRIGLILYNNTWQLNEFHLNTDITNVLLTITHRYGRPKTGEGLTFALQTFRRTGVPKIMILISCGQSTDDVTQPAQRLRDFGIAFYVIGVATRVEGGIDVRNASLQEWTAIASRPRQPEDKYIFIPEQFNLALLYSLIPSICNQIQYQDRKIKGSVGNHSLHYIYTFVLRADEHPSLGITAVGLLDDQPIEVYSSKYWNWVPKTQWMKNNMPAEYWKTGNLKMEALNLTVLEIMQDNCESAVCVLQWRVGCEAEKLGNESLILQKLIEEYHLNGEHVQATNSSWQLAAPVQHASPPGQVLKGARNISRQIGDFLQKECVDQEMRRFIIYDDKEPSAPHATVLPPRNSSRSCILLSCMATGFYPRDIRMSFQKNGVKVPDEDGVISTGTRPNGDGTFQLRKTLEIVECLDPYNVLYECVVEHASTKYLQTLQIINMDGMCGFMLRVRSGIVLTSLFLLMLSHVFFYWFIEKWTNGK